MIPATSLGPNPHPRQPSTSFGHVRKFNIFAQNLFLLLLFLFWGPAQRAAGNEAINSRGKRKGAGRGEAAGRDGSRAPLRAESQPPLVSGHCYSQPGLDRGHRLCTRSSFLQMYLPLSQLSRIEDDSLVNSADRLSS